MGKSHHYVPQFYLRNFSSEQGAKTISLCNVNTGAFHYNCSIKNQACRNFFYGSDQVVEDALAEIESIVSADIKSLLRGGVDYSNTILRVFLVLAHMRTEKTASLLSGGVEELFTMVSEHPNVSNDIKDFLKVMDENPGSLIFAHLSSMIESTEDLSFSVVRNDSTREFITSDNPMLLYNSYLEISNNHSSRGIGLIGTTLFMPVSAKYAIMLHDDAVYDNLLNVKNGLKVLTNRDDVDKLNSLQLIFSDKVLYFCQPYMEKWIAKYLKKFSTFKQKHTSSLNVAVRDKVNDDGSTVYVTDNSVKGRDELVTGDNLFVFHQHNVYAGIFLNFLRCRKEVKLATFSDHAIRPHVMMLERTKWNQPIDKK